LRQCHRNTARLVRRGEAESWCFGFGLVGTIWSEHSWGLARGAVIETTFEHDRYYGVELPSFAAAVAG
jgi:hypothetical protein